MTDVVGAAALSQRDLRRSDPPRRESGGDRRTSRRRRSTRRPSARRPAVRRSAPRSKTSKPTIDADLYGTTDVHTRDRRRHAVDSARESPTQEGTPKARSGERARIAERRRGCVIRRQAVSASRRRRFPLHVAMPSFPHAPRHVRRRASLPPRRLVRRTQRARSSACARARASTATATSATSP